MLETEHWKLLRKLDGRIGKDGKYDKRYVEVLTDNHLVVNDYFMPSTYRDFMETCKCLGFSLKRIEPYSCEMPMHLRFAGILRKQKHQRYPENYRYPIIILL